MGAVREAYWHGSCALKGALKRLAMKTYRPILAILAGALVMMSCGPAVRIYTDIEVSAPFSSYKTYSFLDFTDGNKKTVTGMELERIRVAFAREIEQHGLRFSEDNPDLSVQLTVYHREAMDGYYGRPYRYTYMERAMTVDMYDNLIKRHVWHGAAVGELETDTEARMLELPEIIASIFEKYPVQLEAAP